MSRATINDVARLAGVARTTVSRVLNDAEYVSAESRRAVQDAMTELDYRPRASARTLRRPETVAICIGIDDPADPFVAEVLRGALHAASAIDVPVLVALPDDLGAVLPGIEVGGVLRIITARESSTRSADAPTGLPVIVVEADGTADAEMLGIDAVRRLCRPPAA